MATIKDYFDIKELVCPHVFNKFREYAWQFIDPRLIDTLLVLREKIGRPFIVNNWAAGGDFSQRGLRCNICELVKNKTEQDKLYMSAHSQGMAVDLNVSGMSIPEVHDWVKKNQIWIPHSIRIEDIESAPTWFHLDTRSDGFRTITYFKG